MSGKLVAVVGGMKSGKTGELVHRLNEYQYRDERALGIQPQINERDRHMESRDGRSFESLKVASLGEIATSQIAKYQAIGVDELFMFPASDAVYIYEWLKLDRDVYVASLDVLANGQIPEIYQRILTLGPEIVKRASVCDFCKEPGTHTTAMIDGKRVFPQSNIAVEGGSNSPEYHPSCLDHFDPDTDFIRSLLEK